MIEVETATYRGSKSVAGCFELVDPDSQPRMLWGSMRIEVYCSWHGVKPPTRYPQIKVGENYEIRRNYSGDVVDSLA